jgi:hypothetical protein
MDIEDIRMYIFQLKTSGGGRSQHQLPEKEPPLFNEEEVKWEEEPEKIVFDNE